MEAQGVAILATGALQEAVAALGVLGAHQVGAGVAIRLGLMEATTQCPLLSLGAGGAYMLLTQARGGRWHQLAVIGPGMPAGHMACVYGHATIIDAQRLLVWVDDHGVRGWVGHGS